MPHYTYLIIGGGMTADAAIKGIRQSGRRRFSWIDQTRKPTRRITGRH